MFIYIITAVIQPEGYNMYNCVSQIIEQDYTATRGRPEFCHSINKMLEKIKITGPSLSEARITFR